VKKLASLGSVSLALVAFESIFGEEHLLTDALPARLEIPNQQIKKACK